MFALEPVTDNYFRITGYADGDDWLMTSGKRQIRARDLAASQYLWFYNDLAELRIFDAAERRSIATLAIGNKEKFGEGTRISQSRDGTKLYALVSKTEHQELHVIDPSRGEIAASYDGFPPGWRLAAIERPDAKLLIPTAVHKPESPKQGLVLFDPATGEREESWVPFYADKEDYAFAFGFHHLDNCHSPDGRWWLRPDRTVFPVLDTTPGLIGRLQGQKPERYYGLTLQLWEAFPLRFVRRLTVAWLTTKELPNESAFHLDENNPDPAGARQAVWDTIAETTARVGADPLGEVPRAAFPARYSSDDKEWRHIWNNWAEVARRWARVCGWQPDGKAFWIVTNGFLSCVGTNGTVSPRLYTERKGRSFGTWLPAVPHPNEVWPMNGRTAQVHYRDNHSDGTVVIDGAPSATPHRWSQVPKSQDQWTPANLEERKLLLKRIEAIKADEKKIIVPLAEWSEDACIAAIDALTAQIGDDFTERAVDDDIQAVFAIGRKRFDEQKFFTTVRERFPGAAPAIRRLIDRYVEVNPRGLNLSWRADKGIAIFGHGVQTLGVLDQNALPTLRRYGQSVDAGHEHFFAPKTVPAIIAAHGWTDEVTDLVIWVLLRNFYNALQDYSVVWDKWGLGKAAKQQSPEDFARRVAAELDPIKHWPDDYGTTYGAAGLDRLADELRKPHDVWLQAFFAELERVHKADEARGLGGPFNLLDHSGNTFSDGNLKGRAYLTVFGFTRCREFCRRTLSEVSNILRALGPDADRMHALFITVDPERDTPAVMQDYLSGFDPHWRGLTGDSAAIDALLRSYRGPVRKRLPLHDGEYHMIHPQWVYLTDKDGHCNGEFHYRRYGKPEDAAAELRALL
jgi:cytochrome oxidase Cu insertion factor (SCO1/SenC/PrrC family)